MENTEVTMSGVMQLMTSTGNSLPTGSITYPGNFSESAEAYEVAKILGIRVGTAYGMYTYMFSESDCKIVQEYIVKKRLEARAEEDF